MAQLEMLTVNVMRFPNGAVMMQGAAVTRAAARLQLDAVGAAIGSLYVSTTDGRVYTKVAAAGADTDLYKVTATNAD
jgi:hypothetical protein